MADTLFETPNLAIRRFTTHDDAFIFELLNTPGWKEFIGERNINSTPDAINYLHNGPLALYAEYGYGPWLVTLKETNQPIGMCGLFKRDYLDKPDLGFAFLPGFEGKGFAYESSMATLKYVTDNYNLEFLYATTTYKNSRSQRLLERCGFIRNGQVTPPGEEELLLYRFTLQ
jgi:ribosomal-protein-alanine N-acetyltransferase